MWKFGDTARVLNSRGFFPLVMHTLLGTLSIDRMVADQCLCVETQYKTTQGCTVDTKCLNYLLSSHLNFPHLIVYL